MKIGIIGMTSAGKSALFSAFTGADNDGEGGNTTTGIVKVPDERLDRLSALFNPKKHTNTTVTFEDCPPMDTPVKKDRIRLYDTMKVMDALVGVVGAYRHASQDEIIDELKQLRFEIVMNDLDFVIKRIERLEKEIIKIAKNRAAREKELALMQRLQAVLEGEKALRGMEFDNIEQEIITNANLITLKPVCYVINVPAEMNEGEIKAIEEKVGNILKDSGENSPLFMVNASLEAELSAMDPDEIDEFMKEYGIEESGKDRVIRAVYDMLNLITFFTVGEDECRAWTIRQGGTALDAAATIHTDLARGFIRAEVIEHESLLELKSMSNAKKAGKLRLEGKNYEVRDGDITHIMFNT